MNHFGSAIVYYVVFLFSTTLHEAAHAWAALRGGDRTAYHGGQVTLNPIPHIRREPIGMVALPLLSVLLSGWPIGFASAPYDPAWAHRYPRRSAWMALAGPAGNLVLVFAAALLVRWGLATGFFLAPESVAFDHLVTGVGTSGLAPSLAMLVSVFFSLNLLLATFNLLPFPPLDGAGAIPLLLGTSGGRRYQEMLVTHRGLGLIGILLAWRYFDLLFHPLWLHAVNLVHTVAQYG